MGILLCIEGTDCSGKETQSKALEKRLYLLGLKVARFSYPTKDCATGKIIYGPYLGKTSEGFFEEGATNVPSKVAGLYFAADRLYHKPVLDKALKENDVVILDRYIYSNMAHQASKENSIENQDRCIEFFKKLEFDLLKLKKPDITVFLHMPTEVATKLKSGRAEKVDQHEMDEGYLKRSEALYTKLAKKENFKTIECSNNGEPRPINDISKDLFKVVLENLK